MSRILVIGGYGGFGAKLSRRLAAAGHQVLVGGRNAERATAFACSLAGAEPVQVDRDRDIAPVLEAWRPDLVVDAAGPFQASGFAVPEACIDARIPYLDLADARDFVCGIAALDGRARAAGVAVVSGASSVPALSGAVARHLAEGLCRVTQVQAAISASNRATAGPAVAASILSYVGRPMRLWRGGRHASATGWQELGRERFAVAGTAPIERRLIALCDVPDHDLLPQLLPGRPAVTFRAGTELRFQMLALWLASWPVRWGWARPLTRFARWMLPLQRLTRRAGTDRSAMAVTLKGFRGDQAVERRWTLIADRGDGPEVPTMAAALLAEEMLASRIAPGAAHAAGMLRLNQFEPLFAGLAIRHAVIERRPPAPLYARIMGDAFAALPPALRAIHSVHGDGGAAGQGEVRCGSNPLARLAARLVGFPRAGSYDVHVAFREQAGVERWTRHFGSHRFASELSQSGRRLTERFGPLRFRFDLPADEHGLEMRLTGWALFRLPLPLALAPRTTAREWQDEHERFRFDVRIALPLAGEVIHYSGWLEPRA